jgi:protein-arginine kinase activator protein McsA
MTTRELTIIERGLNPYATLRQIADKVGVSKERVRQILSELNLPTRHKQSCKPHYICNNCGRVFPRIGGRAHNLFCSWNCYKTYCLLNNYATLECDTCGILFTLRYSQLSARVRNGQQHFYCSRSCKGRATGMTYGFAAHPENCGRVHNKV